MPGPLSDHDLLARLVAFDSTSVHGNREIAEFVSMYLADAGAVIERNATDDGERVNVIARFGPAATSDRAGLVLCGHLDVVPANEPEWTSDPFELVERDGTYVARGACDMKGFVALAMNVAYETGGRDLTAPLALLLTFDEELGSLGVQHLARTWKPTQPLPRSVIIGEPTSLRVVRMHKGHLTMTITVTGHPAHSGSPHLGDNAIEPAAAIVTALGRLRETLEAERVATSRFFPEVPFAVLNVARIGGGTALNVIPDACAIELGVRLLPGETSLPMIERVRETVAGVVGPERATVAVRNDNPPMLLDTEASIHRELCAEIGQTEELGVSFASDAGVMQRDLDHDCVLFGPGSIEVAHRPNEYVPIDELRRARATVERMVAARCGTPSEIGKTG